MNTELTDRLNKLYRYFSVIPTAYDDSLSYYEQICAVLKLTLESLSQYQDSLAEAKAYTDEQISNLNNSLRDYINTLIEATNNTITDLDNKINQNQAENNAKFQDVDNEFNKVYVQINTAIENNNEYLIEEISKNLGNQLLVTNFFTGQRVTVQNMFDYLANLHVENGINYTTLAERNYTYDELVALKITYSQMVINGNILIPVK
jgi:hypothetical protein